MRVILHLMFTYCGKRFFRYNLQLFKMKKYMFSLPPDSNSSETFFFNLKVKTVPVNGVSNYLSCEQFLYLIHWDNSGSFPLCSS